jgi:hypothetical protein
MAMMLVLGVNASAQSPAQDPEIQRILENMRRVYETPATPPQATPAPTSPLEPPRVDVEPKTALPGKAIMGTDRQVGARPQAPKATDPLAPIKASGVAGVPDGEELLVDLKVRSTTAARGLQVTKKGNGAMLPLAETVGALFLPLDVQPKLGRATGRILPNDEYFDLDLAAGRVTLGGRSEKLAPGTAIAGAQDIYVDSAALGAWLGGGFKLDPAELTLQFSSDRAFPTLDRVAARQSGAASPADRQMGPPSDKVDLETPYRVLSWPIIDIDTQSSYVRPSKGPSSISSDLNIIGSNDFAYFQSQYFAAGSINQTDGANLSIARATLIRESRSGDLPLGGVRLELGEVQPTSVPLIGGGSFERGLRYTNRSSGFGSQFDATDLIGDAPPGWDVDLFRNGALVSTQSVSANGRYSFLAVPLFAGNNDFKLVFYGPQGQVREETRVVPLGVGLAAPGRLEYDLSVSQQDTPIYDPLRGSPVKAGAPRGSLAMSYGLAQGLSALAGMTTFDAIDRRRSAFQTGLVMQDDDWLWIGNAAADDAGGYGYRGSAQTALWGQRVAFFQGYQDRLVLDPSIGRPNNLWDFGGSILGTLPLGMRAPLSYSLGYNGQREASYNADSVTSRLSYSIPGFSINQGLGITQTVTKSGVTTRTFDGSTSVFFRIGNNFIRSGANYSLDPKPKLVSLTAGTRLRFTPKITSDIGVDWTPSSKTTQVSAAFDVDVGIARIGPRISYDSKGLLQVRLGANFSLAGESKSGNLFLTRDPASQLGAAAVRVFMDERGDGVFHEGDPMVSGVKVELPQTGFSATTDNRGMAFVPRLLPGQATSLIVSEETLGDPTLRAAKPLVAFRPRAGSVTDIDIAITPSADIEGTVVLANDTSAGKAQPQRGVRIDLVRSDGSVAESTTTAFDGLYVFSGVPPGRYRVAISASDIKRLGIEPPPPVYVDVKPQGGEMNIATTELGKAPPIAGGYAVVLGEYGSEFGRLADWILLRDRIGAQANVGLVNVKPSQTEYLTLALGPFAAKTQAEKVCENLRSRSIDCSIRAAGG